MINKLVSIFVLLSMIMGASINVSAYTVGERTYELPIAKYDTIGNANIEGSSVVFNPGGELSYDIYLPFNSISADISYYSSNDTMINLYMGDTLCEIACPSSGNLATYTFITTQRKGSQIIRIKCNYAITISKVVFNKEDISVESKAAPVLPNLSADEVAIQSAVLIDENASAIMVNGGVRYINSDDVKEIPLNIAGSLYLPVSTLARAFGYYYEELPDKGYVLLRKDEVEFCFSENLCYKQFNSGEKVTIENKIVYMNGRTYLPIRYFAEVIGKFVGYTDGIVAIDNKHLVGDVLNSTTVLAYLKGKFSSFHPSNVQGRTFYVAQTPNSSDSNSGTQDSPFRTLDKAGKVALAGDTVIINEGIYRETLSPQNDGTETNPIIFKGQGNVVISACEEINSFVDYDGKIAVAPLGTTLGVGRNQIYYKKEALAEARYPNALSQDDTGLGLSPLWPTKGDLKVTTANSKIVTSTTLLQEEQANYWKDATFVSLHGGGWALGTAQVESSVKGSLNLKNTSKQWWFASTDNDIENYGYLTGTRKAIDTFGEWTCENNMLYIYPPNGETASTLKLEIKKRQLVIDIANRKNVRIDGISTFGGGAKLNNSEMCVINNCNMKYLSHYTLSNDNREGFIDSVNATDQNGAPPRGEMGIYVGGKNNVITNCMIDQSAASGIYLVGKYAYIENNIISNCGYSGSYVGGIFMSTEAWKDVLTPRGGHGIYANTVYNTGRGVFVGSAYEPWLATVMPPILPYEIAYNEFYNGAVCTLDSGTVYMWGILQGSERLKTKIHNNLVYNMQTQKNKIHSAIYHDNWVQMTETYDNMIFTRSENSVYGRAVYVQTKEAFPTSFATVDEWNNRDLGIRADGKASITLSDYPNGKPYNVGSMLGKTDYTLNYERIGSDANSFISKNAVLSQGVALKDGLASFSGNDQYIEFKDVDFAGIRNRISLLYKGDCYNTGDVIDVIVGDDIESGRKYTVTLNAKSPYLNGNNTEDVIVWGTQGKHNIFIKVNDYKSLQFDQLFINSIPVADNFVSKIYGGNFTEAIKGANSPVIPSYAYDQVRGDIKNPIVRNTWGGNVVKYANVYVDDIADTFAYSASTGGKWSGNIINVRIGNVGATPIVTGTIEGTDWTNYTEKRVVLSNPLPAGRYDIYLTFDNVAATSNLYWFGFEKNNK